MPDFTVYHADHGITPEQMEHIQAELSAQADGFFIRQITIPAALGTVPCALWGPAMGDEPTVYSGITPEPVAVCDECSLPVSGCLCPCVQCDLGINRCACKGGPVQPWDA